MTALLDDLAAVRSKVVEGMRAASVHRLSDTELVDAIARAADAVRVLEGVLADAVGEVAHRSRSLARDERLTARTGCRSVNELVQRLTRCSP